MFEFQPITGSYLIVFTIMVALLAMLALIVVSSSRLSLTQQLALVMLRLFVILLVTWIMLRPQREVVQWEKQPATLVMLVDQSRSMTVADGTAGRTRWDVLRESLGKIAPKLDAISEDVELKVYGFDESIKTLDVNSGRVQLPDLPEGQQTAVGKSLSYAVEAETGKRLLGVILFSDGAQRAYPPNDEPPQSVAVSLRNSRTPLWTVAIGQSRAKSAVRDVAVESLLAPETVFVKTQLPVRAEIRVGGYTGQPIPVTLFAEGEDGVMREVARETVTPSATRKLMPVQFELTPEVVGELKLTVQVAEQDGELVATNNRQSTFVRVLGGGLRVLYIEGIPRVESRFIRKSLAASPDISVDYFQVDPADPRTYPADWSERLRDPKYDVVILGDVDATAFSADDLAAMADMVDKGRALMLLGGVQTFGPGGYAKTKLEPVIPVEMSVLERQEIGGKLRDDVQLTGAIPIRPTSFGLMQAPMQLGGDQAASIAAWNSLPPLQGACKFGRPRAAAITLAVGPGDVPVLVTQPWGDGRVLAFAGDTTWQWWLHGHEDLHKRFWRQTVLWLAGKDIRREGKVWVRTARRRYSPGDTVDIVAGATTADGRGAADFDFKADVIEPGGRRLPLSLTLRDDTVEAKIRSVSTPGDYAVEVRASRNGELLGEAKARFLVRAEDLELDNASADIDLMASLARATGGKDLKPEDLPALLEELAKKTEELKVPIYDQPVTYYDKGWLLLLIVILLAMEWFLRKHWGMV